MAPTRASRFTPLGPGRVVRTMRTGNGINRVQARWCRLKRVSGRQLPPTIRPALRRLTATVTSAATFRVNLTRTTTRRRHGRRWRLVRVAARQRPPTIRPASANTRGDTDKPLTCGASRTFTANPAVPVFPARSVAAHTTAVTPTANRVPDGGTHRTGTGPSTASTAAVRYLTTTPVRRVASAVISGGTLTTGGVVSATTTGNDALPTRRPLSTAVQVTVVAPIGKTLPGAGEQPTASGCPR